jgi:hypothetical protein
LLILGVLTIILVYYYKILDKKNEISLNHLDKQELLEAVEKAYP